MPDRGARRTEGPAGPEGACRPKWARRTGGVHAGLRVPAGLSGPPDRGCMPAPAGPPRPRGRGACRTEGAFRTGTPHRSGAPAGRGASRNVAPAPASGGLSLCAFVGRCRRATGTPARPPPVSRWAPPRSRCRRTGVAPARRRSRRGGLTLEAPSESRCRLATIPLGGAVGDPLNRRRPAGGGSPRSGTALHVERSSLRAAPRAVAAPASLHLLEQIRTAPAADGPHARSSRGPRWSARGAGLTLPRRWVYSLRGARGRRHKT